VLALSGAAQQAIETHKQVGREVPTLELGQQDAKGLQGRKDKSRATQPLLVHIATYNVA
jgi:hypothetical protein